MSDSNSTFDLIFKSNFEKMFGVVYQELMDLQKIICPHCDEALDDEDKQQLITYHGNECGDPSRVECPSCEEVFLVTEHVTRTWEVEIVCGDK